MNLVQPIFGDVKSPGELGVETNFSAEFQVPFYTTESRKLSQTTTHTWDTTKNTAFRTALSRNNYVRCN